MIDAFLEAHPHLKRDPDDLKELDARDKLPEENLRSRKRRQMEEEEEEEDDEEEEEEEEEEARSGSSSDSDDRGEEEEEEEEGLLEAARCGDKDRAEQLIKAGCRVDCRDEVCLPHLSPPPSLHPSLSLCHSFFLSSYMYVYIYIYCIACVCIYCMYYTNNKFFKTCMM